MCKDCVRESIIKNAKKVLNLDLTHLTYEQINEASNRIKERLVNLNINVNDNREECIELFKKEFSI